jgi:hypothetical protein
LHTCRTPRVTAEWQGADSVSEVTHISAHTDHVPTHITLESDTHLSMFQYKSQSEVTHISAHNDHVPIHITNRTGGLGLTALISADKEPYRPWAKYLAGINAQVCECVELDGHNKVELIVRAVCTLLKCPCCTAFQHTSQQQVHCCTHK